MSTKAHESKATPGTWAPIDTVPPEVKAEGTDILVALMPGGRQVVAHWDATLSGAPGWAVEGRPVAPTHWQLLGPLPAVSDAKPDAKPVPDAKEE